jgi:hypothetical protein
MRCDRCPEMASADEDFARGLPIRIPWCRDDAWNHSQKKSAVRGPVAGAPAGRLSSERGAPQANEGHKADGFAITSSLTRIRRGAGVRRRFIFK